MKSRVCLLAALAIVVAAAVSMASPKSPKAMYRIVLRDGSEVLTNDRPYHRGSVVLFHRHSNGVLTSLPQEEIVGVAGNAIELQTQRLKTDRTTEGLRPGDVVFLGPTGAGAPSMSPSPGASSSALPGGVYDPRNPAYGGYSGPRTVLSQTGASSGFFSPAAPLAPGELAQPISAEPPTAENPIGSNGFPTSAAGATPLVGPDGQPILAPPGSTGTTPLVIGPNGTPVMAPSGAPGSASPPIGPSGTPVLAPLGTPGSTSPPVGSNGFPSPPAGPRK